MNKSYVEIAKEFVSKNKGPVEFSKIWDAIVAETKMSEDEAAIQVAECYTTLMLDRTLVCLEDGKWDLFTRQKYEVTHPDLSVAYAMEESSRDDGDEEGSEEAEEREELGETNLSEESSLDEETSDSEEDEEEI